MQFDEFSSATCPRCTAPIAIASAACGRCGLSLEPTPDGRHVQAIGPLCPRCDRVDVPGAQFAGVTGRSVHGSCGSCGTPLVLPEALRSSAYEERAVSGRAVDLERLARVEAVDGWQLLDTTVDPAAPERIIAHFRRGLLAPQSSPMERRTSFGRKLAGAPSGTRRKPARPAIATRQDPETDRARRAVEAREARKRMLIELREARRQARFDKRMARIAKGNRPAGRHTRGVLRGGNMAAVGLVSLVAHMLVLTGWVLFRFIAVPMFMLALAIFRTVFEALMDELHQRPRRRAAYRRAAYRRAAYRRAA